MKIDYYILSWFMTIIVGSIFSGIVFSIALNDCEGMLGFILNAYFGLIYSLIFSFIFSIPGLIISILLFFLVKNNLSSIIALQVLLSLATILIFYNSFNEGNFIYPLLGLVYIPVGTIYTNHLFKKHKWN